MSRIVDNGGPPEIPDQYVGSVYGNILDQYDNPAYVITLSIPSPELAKQGLSATPAKPAVGVEPAAENASAQIAADENPVLTVDQAERRLDIITTDLGATRPLLTQTRANLAFQQARERAGSLPNPLIIQQFETAIKALEAKVAALELAEKEAGKALDDAAKRGPDISGSDRSDSPPPASESGAGPAPAPSAPLVNKINRQGDRVIIAQTGVTATQIDDVELETFPDIDASAAGTITRSVKFRVTQPGGANLLDQIQYAKQFLGYSEEELATTGPTRFLLDISFVGYTSNPDDNEAGGQRTTIDGVYSWLIEVTKLNIRVDQTGSYYDFEGAISGDIGYADQYFKTPRNFATRGATITEHVEELVKQWNLYLAENQSSKHSPDTIDIDLSELIGTGSSKSQLIRDESVTQSTTDQAESSNRPMNDEVSLNTREEQQRALRNAPRDTGDVDKIAANGLDSIDIKESTSVYDIFATLLSMNDEFKQMMSRKKNIKDPGDNEVDNDQTFVTWFKVRSEVGLGAWDPERNDYTKHIKFVPYLTKSARGDIVLTNTEHDYLKNMRGDDAARIATKRLNDLASSGNLVKSYYYLFTGKNDQIIDLELEIDNGLTYLVPPRGGYTSDVSLTSAQNFIAQVPVNKDLSLKDLKNSAKKIAGAQKLISAVKNSVARIGGEIGDAIDAAEGVASRLTDTLDSASLLQLRQDFDAEFSAKSRTPTQNESLGDYNPEISGQIYASDFVTGSGSKSIEELEDNGFIVLDPNISSSAMPALQVTDQPNPLQNATYNANEPSNMLFGFVYRQQQNMGFLRQLTLKLRGDPWYLGQDPNRGRVEYDKEKNSSKRSAAWIGNANYFVLQINTPTAYDIRVDDEDKNTGYWPSNISNSFSGVYMYRRVINRFERGIYTCEVEAVKEATIPLHLIKPKILGLKLDDKGNLVDETANDFYSRIGVGDVSEIEAFELGIGGQTLPSASGTGSGDSITISAADLPALQFDGEKGRQLKANVESYLGKPISDKEFQMLVRATIGESGGSPREDANVMAVILNRVKSQEDIYKQANTIESVLNQKNQFQAVTGTPNARTPSKNFSNPTQQQIARVVQNSLNNLDSANKTWLNFTAYDSAAYGPGTGISFRTTALNTPGHEIIGGTIFFTKK